MRLSDMKRKMQALKNMKELIEWKSDTTDNPNPEYIKYPANIVTSEPGGPRGYGKKLRLLNQLRNEELRHILTNYPESRRQDMENLGFLDSEYREKLIKGEKLEKINIPMRDLPHLRDKHGFVRGTPSRNKLRIDDGNFNPDLTEDQIDTANKIMLQKRGGKYDPDYGRALLRKKKVKKAKPKRKSVKKCICKK